MNCVEETIKKLVFLNYDDELEVNRTLDAARDRHYLSIHRGGFLEQLVMKLDETRRITLAKRLVKQSLRRGLNYIIASVDFYMLVKAETDRPISLFGYITKASELLSDDGESGSNRHDHYASDGALDCSVRPPLHTNKHERAHDRKRTNRQNDVVRIAFGKCQKI